MGDETVTCGHSSRGALVGIRSCSSPNRTSPVVGTADEFFLLFLETRSPRSRASRVGFRGGRLSVSSWERASSLASPSRSRSPGHQPSASGPHSPSVTFRKIPSPGTAAAGRGCDTSQLHTSEEDTQSVRKGQGREVGGGVWRRTRGRLASAGGHMQHAAAPHPQHRRPSPAAAAPPVSPTHCQHACLSPHRSTARLPPGFPVPVPGELFRSTSIKCSLLSGWKAFNCRLATGREKSGFTHTWGSGTDIPAKCVWCAAGTCSQPRPFHGCSGLPGQRWGDVHL